MSTIQFFENYARRLPTAELLLVGLIIERAGGIGKWAPIHHLKKTTGLDRDAKKRVFRRLVALKVIERNPRRKREYRVLQAGLDGLAAPRLPSREYQALQRKLEFLNGIPTFYRIPGEALKDSGIKQWSGFDRLPKRLLPMLRDRDMARYTKRVGDSDQKVEARRKAWDAVFAATDPFGDDETPIQESLKLFLAVQPMVARANQTGSKG